MISIDQLIKLAGNLPLDKIGQTFDKIGLPLDKLAGNAAAKAEEFKNRERMSSVDTAWLRMDTQTNLMMIVGVMMFDGAFDIARFKRTLEKRLSRYRRFRQRVVQDPSGAYWVEDEHFDIDNHVQVVNLPVPGGKQALEQYVAGLTMQSLDVHKPLWQMTVVENYDGDGISGSAVVIRIHHCIADGIALIGVMYSLTDTEPDALEEGIEPEALRRARERRAAKREAAGERDFMAGMFEPITGAAAKAYAMSGGVLAKSMDVMSQPDKFGDYAKVAADVAAEIAKLATLPADSATSFKGKPSAVKRVAWSAPLPLADVKAVCKVLGVSVNDVLLASVAGAMRNYLAARGEADDNTEVRGFVPVNLRPRGDEHKLGNHFGLVALTLPVGIANPFARVYEVKRRMDELKTSYQAALSMGILGTVGFLPRQVQKQVLDMFSSKGSAVMTNVPGPQIPLYLAGRRLEQQMFWVPQSGDIGMGVSILSYNGQVQFGLITDRKFVPEPAQIVDRFASEFEKIVLYLLIEGAPPEQPASAAPAAPAESPAQARRAKPATPSAAKKAVRKRPAPPKTAPAKSVAPKKVALKDLATAVPTPETEAPVAPKPPGMKRKGLLARARA